MADRAAGDLLERACAVYDGVVSDPGRYADDASGLVLEARAAAHPESLVVALRAQAWAERSRFADVLAKTLLDEAAQVARSHGLSVRLGEVLTSRGAVNLELGRIPAARRDLDRAHRLVGADNSAALLQQAVLLHNIGRLTDAAALYRIALTHPDATAHTRATVANNLAMIEMAHGRVHLATAALEEASRFARDAGPAQVALVKQTGGWVAVQAGRLTEGLRRFDEAAVLYEKAGLPLAEHYLEYVDALIDLRLLPEAMATSRRAIDAFDASDVPLMAAEARWRLARLCLLSGDLDQARPLAVESARTFRTQRRPVWAAQADLVDVLARTRDRDLTARDLAILRRAARTLQFRGNSSAAIEAHLAAGRAAIRLDRPVTALRDLERAWELARHAPVLQRLNGRVAAALAATVRRQDAEVLRHCRAGLADLDGHRASFDSIELRALAAGHGDELGRIALRVALRSASPAGVLGWMERTRAASSVAVDPQPVDGQDDRLAELRAAQAELDRARASGDGESAELLARVNALEGRARRSAWTREGDGRQRATVLSAQKLRQLLGERVLVEYATLDDQLVAAILDSRRTRLIRLGDPAEARSETDALLFALRRLAAGGSPAATALARRGADVALTGLHELLVAPLGLGAETELVVVPSVALWRVPWSALHTAPVALAPSASQWARTLQAPLEVDRAGTVLVAGPGLPGAVGEIDALAALHADAEVLQPPDSTVAEVARALERADLAHLACHCRLRADSPAFSSLQLSDGPLSVHEIDLRGRSPRRVVLAACDSAADVGLEGEQLLGFVSALLSRGTAALVASVVPVPDADAVTLMCALHDGLRRGESMATALHAARGSLDRDDPRTFVAWCAFSAFGAA